MTMSTSAATSSVAVRPKRADARRNYDKIIAAARAAFTEGGAETSLEGIARRAGVGIGTLYRNFPNRQGLLEAVYVDEVDKLSASVSDFEGMEPLGCVRRMAAALRHLHVDQAGARRRTTGLCRP